MKKYILLALLILTAGVACAEPELKLKDFKVDQVSVCTATKLDMGSLMDKWEHAVTEMKESMHGDPDFSGHYYVATLPTPKGGVFSYAFIDCLTGKQVASSNTYTLYNESASPNGYKIRYLATSSLFIVDAIVADESLATIYQTEYYQMKDGKLELIKKANPKVISKKE